MQVPGGVGVMLLTLSMTLGTLFNLQLAGRTLQVQAVEVVLIVILLVAILSSKMEHLRLSSVDVLIIGLWVVVALWSFLTCFWAKDPYRALISSVAFLEGLLAFLVCKLLLYRPAATLTAPIRVMTVSLALQILVMFLGGSSANVSSALPTTVAFYSLKKDYAAALMGRSNYLAFYFGFAVVYELLAHRKGWLVFSAFALIGLILTLSRGGVLSVVLALTLAIPFVWARRLHGWKDWMWNAAVVAIALGVLVTTSIGQILVAALGQGLGASSVGSRLELWLETVDEIREEGVLLVGAGLNWERDPHNVVLRSVRDLGLIGGVPLLLLVAFPWLSCAAPARSAFAQDVVAVQTAYLSVLLHSFIEPMFHSPDSQIFLGIILAYMSRASVVRKLQLPRPVRPFLHGHGSTR